MFSDSLRAAYLGTLGLAHFVFNIDIAPSVYVLSVSFVVWAVLFF